MGILQVNTNVTGQIDVNPRRVTIISSDNLATVTAAGYLNTISLQGFVIVPTDEIVMWYGYVSNTNPGTFAIFTPTIVNGVITLNIWENPGNVLLPVVAGDFAVFIGTTGQIRDAGFLPSDATKTRVVMAGSATVIGNMAKFVDVNGTVDDTAGAVTNLGNILAGASGTAGTFTSFPPTAANGSLVLAAINAGGAFTTTISNSVMAQSTVYSIPDVGAATGFFVVNPTQGHMKTVTAGAVAGGAASQVVTDAFCTTTSTVLANWNTSANAVSIQKVTPGNGSFTVLSSGDPGASTIGYMILK